MRPVRRLIAQKALLPIRLHGYRSYTNIHYSTIFSPAVAGKLCRLLALLGILQFGKLQQEGLALHLRCVFSAAA